MENAITEGNIKPVTTVWAIKFGGKLRLSNDGKYPNKQPIERAGLTLEAFYEFKKMGVTELPFCE